ISQPPPWASPLTAAMIGFGNVSILLVNRCPRRTNSRKATAWPRRTLAAKHAMSAPDEKAAVAGAGQDERAGTIIVLDGVEHLHQSIDQCVIERVELFGPIQREQRDGPVLLDQDNFRHRGRRPSDSKITVAGHVLENSALDVVGQTPAVLIEPAVWARPRPAPSVPT